MGNSTWHLCKFRRNTLRYREHLLTCTKDWWGDLNFTCCLVRLKGRCRVGAKLTAKNLWALCACRAGAGAITPMVWILLVKHSHELQMCKWQFNLLLKKKTSTPSKCHCRSAFHHFFPPKSKKCLSAETQINAWITTSSAHGKAAINWILQRVNSSDGTRNSSLWATERMAPSRESKGCTFPTTSSCPEMQKTLSVDWCLCTGI